MGMILSGMLLLAGCGEIGMQNILMTADTEGLEENTQTQQGEGPESGEELTEESCSGEESDEGRAVIGGPFGQISVKVPEGWSCVELPVGDDRLNMAAYGLQLIPEETDFGYIEIGCMKSFGVCGTGLVEEKTTIAGKDVLIGTYDGHAAWDFVSFQLPEENDFCLVAQNTGGWTWTEEMGKEGLQILDSLILDPEITQGGISFFHSDAEAADVGVTAALERVTDTGAVLKLQQFDGRITAELFYGEEFSIQRNMDGEWVDVPTIGEPAFIDIAYTITPGETTERQIDWEWLYGQLEPGEYRISKKILSATSPGVTETYVVSPHFLLAGEPYETTDEEAVLEDTQEVYLLKDYEELTDGTFECSGYNYRYKLEITGRMGGASKDSTFVYLSNIEEISFDQAWKAAGFSSNMADYFDPEDAVLVEMRSEYPDR